MDKERSGETMKLGAFFHPTGNHVAAWLHPEAQIDAGTNSISMVRFPTSPRGNSHSAGLVIPVTSSTGRGRNG
jgi:hypothetical protein